MEDRAVIPEGYYLIPDDYHKWRWRFLTAWVIGFTILILGLFYIVQSTRIESCRRGYEGTREIFKPFLAPKLSEKQVAKLEPKQRAAYKKQQADQTKFNNTITGLKANCRNQVRGGSWRIFGT